MVILIIFMISPNIDSMRDSVACYLVFVPSDVPDLTKIENF